MKKQIKYIMAGVVLSTSFVGLQQLTPVVNNSTEVQAADTDINSWMPDVNVQQAVASQLSIDKSQITKENIQSLKELNLSNVTITSLQGLNLANQLTKLKLTNVVLPTKMDSKTFFNIPTLTELTINDSHLKSSQLESGLDLPNLTHVDISNNDISSLDFLLNIKLPKIEKINADNNNITSLEVFRNPMLRSEMTEKVIMTGDGNHIIDFRPLEGMTINGSTGARNQTYNQTITLPKPTRNGQKYEVPILPVYTNVMKPNYQNYTGLAKSSEINQSGIEIQDITNTEDDNFDADSDSFNIVSDSDPQNESKLKTVFDVTLGNLPNQYSYSFRNSFDSAGQDGTITVNINWVDATDNDNSNSATNPTPQSGIVNYIDGYGVLLWRQSSDSSGLVASQKFQPANSYVSYYGDYQIIDGIKYYHLANQNYWIQAQYLQNTKDLPEIPLDSDTIIVAGNVPYGIFLRNDAGELTEQLIQPSTSWRAFAKKTFNGHTYYRLGNNNQWLEDTYVKSIS